MHELIRPDNSTRALPEAELAAYLRTSGGCLGLGGWRSCCDVTAEAQVGTRDRDGVGCES